MKKPGTVIFAICLLASVAGCYYDKSELLYGAEAPCDTTVVARFSSEVLPVMRVSCNTGGCHNNIDAAGGVILDTYNGVKAQAINGRLMGSINHTGGYSPMPKGSSRLTSCTIIKIQQWINAGITDN